jgi:uncharacterized membrane protein
VTAMIGVDGGLEVGDWQIAEDISRWIEVLAIAVITVGVVAAFAFGARTAASRGVREAVERVKQGIGRALLLGLDLLIAADVIRTVTLEPTLLNVTALGVLVLVRTFLSWSLMVELHGRWPWQGSEGAAGPPRS